MSPPSNSYVEILDDSLAESFYPLHTYVCDRCYLVQLSEFETPEQIFSDYAYFSSYSDSWLSHAKAYTNAITHRFNLNSSSQVIEIASNDGYLLQYFKEKGIPVLGIEPAANVAEVAEKKGVPTLVSFFGEDTARFLVNSGKKADLLIGNNVLAHVPDLNDFIKGMKIVLNSDGLITLEFPHLLQLMNHNQFDTIYHEHFSYFSLLTIDQIFAFHGLTIFDVEELPTHGGSLRIYARHNQEIEPRCSGSVQSLKDEEFQKGLCDINTYTEFTKKVEHTKRQLLSFLIQIKEQGKTIAGYGAPAKGNTLLNYCGIRTDFLDYTVDRSPYKQGKLLPGTHIPVHHPDKILQTQPDYLLILPWNIKDEIIESMTQIRDWGGQFVIPIPKVQIVS